MRPRLLALLLLIALSAFAAGKLETTGEFPDSSAPAALRAALESRGYRLIGSDGSVLCEIWLRRALPARPRVEAEGIFYSELGPSVLVGMISYPKGGHDFRGQTIQPGAYTLRYELLPNDGNHLGVAPDRDFLLLLPIAVDPGPDTTIPYDRLVKLSAQAAGAHHPAPLSLTLLPAGNLPQVFQTGDSYEAFAATLATQSGGKLPFALIVKGEAQQ
jgi:hypothetical protein